MGKLASGRSLRSLAIPTSSRGMGPQGEPRWLAAAAFDGTVELWDVAIQAPGAEVGPAQQARHRLQSYAGSDGEVLQWSADGGGLAVWERGVFAVPRS